MSHRMEMSSTKGNVYLHLEIFGTLHLKNLHAVMISRHRNTRLAPAMQRATVFLNFLLFEGRCQTICKDIFQSNFPSIHIVAAAEMSQLSHFEAASTRLTRVCGLHESWHRMVSGPIACETAHRRRRRLS